MAFVLHNSGTTCWVSLVQSPAPAEEEVPWLYPVSAIHRKNSVLSLIWLNLMKVTRSVASGCCIDSSWLPVYLNLVVTLQSQALNYRTAMADLTDDISSKVWRLLQFSSCHFICQPHGIFLFSIGSIQSCLISFSNQYIWFLLSALWKMFWCFGLANMSYWIFATQSSFILISCICPQESK